jgi:hypothetical protein
VSAPVQTISVISASEGAHLILAGYNPVGFAGMPRGTGKAALFSIEARETLQRYLDARDKLKALMGQMGGAR